ncbi:MAG TPA: hypothetical protein VJU84_16740 [Pyrinomonadaceae bacterium]|nr:hypothetical protein [Pyrinomonadaceae bacterium]
MSKLFVLAFLFSAVCLLSAPAPSIAGGAPHFATVGPLADPTSVTVTVKCAKGDSINSALSKYQGARSLVVEISGMCHENVVVNRDRVTLRGTDPATDGIDAVENTDFIDAAVWVREAHRVTLENLKLTGGFGGLLATNVSTPLLRVINCRMEGNRFGALVQSSIVEANNSSLGPNDGVNAEVFLGSRFICLNCTMTDPQVNAPSGANRTNVIVSASRLVLNQSTLTGGGIQSEESLVMASDSTIEAAASNLQGLGTTGGSTVSLTRVQITGQLVFNQNTSVQLFGVTQLPGAAGTPPNQANHSTIVRLANAVSPTGNVASDVGLFNLNDFSNLSLLDSSEVAGLNCNSGSNAFCSNPANVGGTSNCGLCPKP